MENKIAISNINSKIKTENGILVTFIGESITFRLSIEEIYFVFVTIKRPKFQ